MHGNGGKSSHQRTCAVYHETQAESWKRNLTRYREQGASGIEIRNAERLIAEHQAALADITARAAQPPAAAEG